MDSTDRMDGTSGHERYPWHWWLADIAAATVAVRCGTCLAALVATAGPADDRGAHHAALCLAERRLATRASMVPAIILAVSAMAHWQAAAALLHP